MKTDVANLRGLIGKNSGGDFLVTYASATTLTLGTYPNGASVTADDIVAIEQYNSSGKLVATWERDERTMSMATNTLTVTGANFGATDVFVIYTNVPRDSYAGGSSMLARGSESTAANDNYATIVTPSKNCTRILVSLKGSYDAIISLDGGTTEHFVMPAGSVVALDNLPITSGVAIKAKNKTVGSNYSELNISVW